MTDADKIVTLGHERDREAAKVKVLSDALKKIAKAPTFAYAALKGGGGVGIDAGYADVAQKALDSVKDDG